MMVGRWCLRPKVSGLRSVQVQHLPRFVKAVHLRSIERSIFPASPKTRTVRNLGQCRGRHRGFTPKMVIPYQRKCVVQEGTTRHWRPLLASCLQCKTSALRSFLESNHSLHRMQRYYPSQRAEQRSKCSRHHGRLTIPSQWQARNN
jgi:hypothetical protein